MKFTKFEHACFALEKYGQVIVVDPGNFTSDFIIPSGVATIVITHEHSDHFDQPTIANIAQQNPGAVVIAHESITQKLSGVSTKAVQAGDSIDIGGFRLEFFGGTHATIDPSLTPLSNLGVMINDSLYYPGDSFAAPNKPAKTLLLPIGAPWLKLSEAVAFAREVSPKLIIPTHDAVLSDIGKRLADNLVPSLTKISYQRLHAPVMLD